MHLSREHVYRLVAKTPQRLNLDVLAALCDILECEPSDLLQPSVQPDQASAATGTGAGDGGPGIGDLRPIRATIRRPDGT